MQVKLNYTIYKETPKSIEMLNLQWVCRISKARPNFAAETVALWFLVLTDFQHPWDCECYNTDELHRLCVVSLSKRLLKCFEVYRTFIDSKIRFEYSR